MPSCPRYHLRRRPVTDPHQKRRSGHGHAPGLRDGIPAPGRLGKHHGSHPPIRGQERTSSPPPRVLVPSGDHRIHPGLSGGLYTPVPCRRRWAGWLFLGPCPRFLAIYRVSPAEAHGPAQGFFAPGVGQQPIVANMMETRQVILCAFMSVNSSRIPPAISEDQYNIIRGSDNYPLIR